MLAEIFFKLWSISFWSLNLNQPQVDKSIIEIFFSDSFDFEEGKEDGGNKTIILPFELVINLSIVFSYEIFSEKLANRYSSNLLELGSFNFLSLLAEPRTI